MLLTTLKRSLDCQEFLKTYTIHNTVLGLDMYKLSENEKGTYQTMVKLNKTK